jgi:Tol biopolymer transport system component
VALASRGDDEPAEGIPVSTLAVAPPAVRAELATLGRILFQTGVSAFEAELSGAAGKAADIYTIGADGSGRRLLTPPAGRGVDVAPVWSPDGTKIAFTSWRDGGGAIHVMNADGSGVRRLTTAAGNEVAPQWSADGRRIAFLTARENVFADLWVMNADGTEQQRLLEGGYAIASWGPGDTIATVGEAGDLMVIGPDQSVVLGDAGALNVDVVWSPDGSRILFQAGGFSSSTLYAVPADGSAAPRPFPAAGEDPVWSPDGSRVALVSDERCCGALIVARADGTGVRKLADWARPADWSPDGAYVLWLDIFGPDDRNAIATTPAAGGTSYRITRFLDESIVTLDWAPR